MPVSSDEDTAHRATLHRVRNQFQILTSMVSLYSNKSNKHEIARLTSILGRLHAMGALHECVHRNIGRSDIPFNEYIERVLTLVIDNYSFQHPTFKLYKGPIANHMGDPDQFGKIGYIVAELATNSLLHALNPGVATAIGFWATADDDMLNIFYFDNGPYFQQPHEPVKDASGMGLSYATVRSLLGEAGFVSTSELTMPSEIKELNTLASQTVFRANLPLKSFDSPTS